MHPTHSIHTMWTCVSTSRFGSHLNVAIGRLALRGGEETARRAGREPARYQWPGYIELLNDRAQPAPQMADFRSAATQEREQGTGPGGGPEEMGQAVGALGKLYRLYAGLVEQNGSLEHIHWWSIEPGSQVDVAPPVLPLSFNDSRSGFTGEPCGMQQIIVLKNPDGSGPLERGEGGFDRATQRVIERQKPWRFAGAEHEV